MLDKRKRLNSLKKKKHQLSHSLDRIFPIGRSRSLISTQIRWKNGIISYEFVDNDLDLVHGLLKVEGALVDLHRQKNCISSDNDWVTLLLPFEPKNPVDMMQQMDEKTWKPNQSKETNKYNTRTKVMEQKINTKSTKEKTSTKRKSTETQAGRISCIKLWHNLNLLLIKQEDGIITIFGIFM